ncbi:MAG: hypothetical protein LDLANPLL_00522 [Turneriella sp.]|nr:hypothetical protein [Turneriella sp.]
MAQKLIFLVLTCFSFITCLVGFSCKKVPTISYLSPLDRTQEGFLDATTYQIVSFGYALDFKKPYDLTKTFVPSAINDVFDQEAFTAFNTQHEKLIREKKPTSGILLSAVLAAEANYLNPQELDISVLDESIRAPMEIKRVLFDNACTNARIVGLYRWILTYVAQVKLLHGATLPNEAIAKTNLDKNYFPPQEYYTNASKALLKNLDNEIKNQHFRYEIVQEVFSKPEKLECKTVIHIHKKQLQLLMPFLAPL